jgi:hypothetical protein
MIISQFEVWMAIVSAAGTIYQHTFLQFDEWMSVVSANGTISNYFPAIRAVTLAMESHP